MSLNAAELRKRLKLERSFSSGPNSPSRSMARPGIQSNFDSHNLFPPLVPTLPTNTPASTAAPVASAWSDGPPVSNPADIARTPTYSDSFTLSNINLDIPETGGTFGQATLSQVMEQVMAMYNVKVNAVADRHSHQYTFHLKSESETELDKAKRYLITSTSPISKTTVYVPEDTIAHIFGPSGQTLDQICVQTGVRIKISPKEPVIRGSTSGTTIYSAGYNGQEEGNIYFLITIEGAAPFVEEAVVLINHIIANHVSRTTQCIRDISAHLLPFVVSHKSSFEGLVGYGLATFHHSAVEREITVSGEYEAVARVMQAVKVAIEGYKRNLTSVKIPLPKRQHRLFGSAAIEEIFSRIKCVIVVPSPEDDSDEVVVWGQVQDLPNGVVAVMEQAKSQYAHELPLPGPIAFSKQILVYMTCINYLPTLCSNYKGVNIYKPHPSVIPNASTLSIDIVGPRAGVDAVVRQISVFVVDLLGSIRQVTIHWSLHSAIIGRHATRIELFHNTHNVSIYFPPEDVKKSIVMLVYDPLSPSASSIQAEKNKHLQHVTVELLKLANEMANIKTEIIHIQKCWHEIVLSQRDTIVNAIVGKWNGLSIKVGAEVRNAIAEDIVLIRGISSDVERAVKAILRIVEDAKNDAIMSSYSAVVEIDRTRVYGKNRILFAQDASIVKLREELGVKVDVLMFDEEQQRGKKEGGPKKSKIVITGFKENVEEARRRILGCIARLTDEVQEILKIPPLYHPSLMGQGGKNITHLEKKFGVKIVFPRQCGDNKITKQLKSDEVLIQGDRKGAFHARLKLLEDLESKKESVNIIYFMVPQCAIPLIVGHNGSSINEIQTMTDTQIEINEPGPGDDPELAKVNVCGDMKAVADARAIIEAIVAQFDEEETFIVSVDHKYHSSIIGTDGQRLRDLIAKCGGPTDSRLQARLIRFPRQGDDNMNRIQLCGRFQLINKLKAELEKTVRALKSYVVLAIEVPVEQRNTLKGCNGQPLVELQTKFGVQIHFPGPLSYYQVGEADNAADFRTVDPAHIVKVSGPRPACEKAIQALKVNTTTPEVVTAIVPVPLKYRNAILQQEDFLHNVRSYGVTIDMSALPTIPSNPPLNDAELPFDSACPVSEVSWDVIPNYQNAEEGSVEWTLKGHSRASLDNVATVIADAIARAKIMSHIGFLTLPSRSNFLHTFGGDGNYFTRLGKETGVDITFHKTSNAIVIIGAENDMLAARDALLATAACA